MAKILVVDNEPDTVDLIKSILERYGFHVTTAYNGRQCLEKHKKGKHDLILLDIMMPDMSGWEVYRKIRDRDKETKIAFVSVIEVSPERKESLKRNGISEYITKPFTSEELLQKVKAII